MSSPDTADDRRLKGILAALRTAKAAAIAGLVFAVIMTVALILFRGAFPLDAYLDTQANPSADDIARGRIALALIPYGGIAFLWFTAALNFHIGHPDFKLFTVVFIGSGLLFVAMIFIAGALASGELTALAEGIALVDGVRVIPAVAVNELLIGYGARMAAVFTISLSTMGRLRGVLPTWLSALGMVTGIFLLLVPFGVAHVDFVFPVWVAIVSLYLLITNPGGKALKAQVGL
jgi:hypothetical protein